MVALLGRGESYLAPSAIFAQTQHSMQKKIAKKVYINHVVSFMGEGGDFDK